jgi:tetratricopeptide (TPR) repeat protein
VCRHAAQRPGNAHFLESLGVLEREGGNIVHLFKRQIALGDRSLPNVVHATLMFSQSSNEFRPSTELVDELLSCRANLAVPFPRELCFGVRGILLYHLGRYPPARRDLEDALEGYTSLGDLENASICLMCLGHIHCKFREFGQAVQRYTRARENYTTARDAWGQAQSLRSLGEVHRLNDEYNESMQKYAEAHGKFREVGDRTGAADCLVSLGALHRFRGNYEQAMSDLSQAYAISSQTGSRRSEAVCLTELAILHGLRGECDQAFRQLSSARDIFTKLGDRRHVACCLIVWANIHIPGQGHDRAECMQNLNEALDICLDIGDAHGEMQCKRRLGSLHHSQHEYAQAADNLGQALDLALSTGDHYEIALCRIQVGLLHCSQCDYTRALKQVLTARALLEGIGLGPNAVGCLALIACIQAAQTNVRCNIQSQCILLTGLAHAQNAS